MIDDDDDDNYLSLLQNNRDTGENWELPGNKNYPSISTHQW